jgi:hypothetical protein
MPSQWTNGGCRSAGRGGSRGQSFTAVAERSDCLARRAARQPRGQAHRRGHAAAAVALAVAGSSAVHTDHKTPKSRRRIVHMPTLPCTGSNPRSRGTGPSRLWLLARNCADCATFRRWPPRCGSGSRCWARPARAGTLDGARRPALGREHRPAQLPCHPRRTQVIPVPRSHRTASAVVGQGRPSVGPARVPAPHSSRWPAGMARPSDHVRAALRGC